MNILDLFDDPKYILIIPLNSNFKRVRKQARKVKIRKFLRYCLEIFRFFQEFLGKFFGFFLDFF